MGRVSQLKRKEKGVRVGVDSTSSGYIILQNEEMGLAKKSQNSSNMSSNLTSHIHGRE